MFAPKELESFDDKLTVDYLDSTWLKNQKTVEELALFEMQSMELAMPRFNTLACLNKTDFNKFMMNFRKKYTDGRMFIVMVAATVDTMTCMIKNSKFYETFTEDNKRSRDLLIDLLCRLRFQLHLTKGIENVHLETLITMLERSAQRIENEKDLYVSVTEMIKQVKLRMERKIAEDKMDVDAVEAKAAKQITNGNTPRLRVRTDLINTATADEPKENVKPPVLPKVKETESNTEFDINITDDRRTAKKLGPNKNNNKPHMTNAEVIIIDDKTPTKNHLAEKKNSDNNTKKGIIKAKNRPAEQIVVSATVHAAPLEPQANKSTNAFDIMMQSSKRLTKKKKGNL